MNKDKNGFDVESEERALKYHTVYKNLVTEEHYDSFLKYYNIQIPNINFNDFNERQKQNFYYWFEAKKSLNYAKTSQQKGLYSSIMSGFKLCYERIIEIILEERENKK